MSVIEHLQEKFAQPALWQEPIPTAPKNQMNITNVLVVDDDIAVCRILHRMISDEQYTVRQANLLPTLSQPSNENLLMSM